MNEQANPELTPKEKGMLIALCTKAQATTNFLKTDDQCKALCTRDTGVIDNWFEVFKHIHSQALLDQSRSLNRLTWALIFVTSALLVFTIVQYFL